MKFRKSPVRVFNEPLLGTILFSLGLCLAVVQGQQSSGTPKAPPSRQAVKSGTGSRTVQLTPRVRYRRIQPGTKTQVNLRKALTLMEGKAAQPSTRAASPARKLANGFMAVTLDPWSSMHFGTLQRSADGEEVVACTRKLETFELAEAPASKGVRQ